MKKDNCYKNFLESDCSLVIECLFGIVSPKTFGKVVFLTSEPVSLFNPVRPSTCCGQGWAQTQQQLSSSVTQVLGLQVYVTMPRFYPSFAVCLVFTHTQKPKLVAFCLWIGIFHN